MVAGMGAWVLVSLLHGRGLTNAIAFGVVVGLKNGVITKVTACVPSSFPFPKAI